MQADERRQNEEKKRIEYYKNKEAKEIKFNNDYLENMFLEKK